MGKVTYLTGAPATGKSRLCDNLKASAPELKIFSYSEILREHLRVRSGQDLDASAIRHQSALAVTSADIEEVDRTLINLVENHRKTNNVVIDSHPVTKEEYGFRVTAFSVENLRALDPDLVVCLYSDPQTLVKRITLSSEGRPLPSEFELSLHVNTQVNVATQYGILIGKPVYLLDSSVPEQKLLSRAAKRMGLI